MPLNPIQGGLRRLRYDSKAVAKVELRVQPGDELEVSADVAGQLSAADPHFKPVDPEPEAEPNDDDVVEALRAEYREVTGKDPDGRWKTAETLRRKLDEARATSDSED